MQFQMKPVFF